MSACDQKTLASAARKGLGVAVVLAGLALSFGAAQAATLPDEAKAVQVAGRVWELTQFLVHVLDVQLTDKGEPVRVTWHASCHAQREMGVVEEPKALLRQLANVELVELKREKECCGFGGTFAVRHPEISAAMVGDKVADIEGTGAARVVSGDCGCLLNIGGALEAGAKAARGQHIAQFLKERIHGR